MRFARHIRLPFEKYIKPRFAGLPVRYLEIGIYEGACLEWMFTNVLTNQLSRADAVDPWIGYTIEEGRFGKPVVHTQEAMDTLYSSVSDRMAKYNKRCELHRMTSTEFTGKYYREYDLIMIDGLHEYDNVLADALSFYKHVLPTGLMVFDDYHMEPVKRAVEDFIKTASDVTRIDTYYTSRCQRCLKIW